MTLKLAIWDIDGTIVDSRDIISEAMSRAFETAGLSAPSYDQTRQIVGLSIKEAVMQLAPDVDDLKINELAEGYKQAFVQRRSEEGFKEPLYDGAVELLEDMVEDGWLMGVATGKSRKGLSAIFDMHGLDRFFDTHWCADDGPSKPNPFMIERNMAVLGCDTSETLMIGDATHDMAMAKAANVHAVGVTWGFGKEHEVRGAGADEIHHDFTSLRTSLMSIGGKAIVAA